MIIITRNIPRALELAGWTQSYIEKNYPDYQVFHDLNPPPVEGDEVLVGLKPGLVISIGGDGTILRASRRWGFDGTPILGVNMGTLGFLAEVEPQRYEDLLKLALSQKADLEERRCLDILVTRDGKLISTVPVLNDAVINKGALARILNLKLRVDDSSSWVYKADGVIISTTTGSTAYNISAGGPVLHPTLSAFVVTPICPFTLSSRPLVLPLSSRIEVTIEMNTPSVYLTTDGQRARPLVEGDVVTAKSSTSVIRLVKNPHRAYLDTLRLKLGLFKSHVAGDE
ncbi:MAG: NAD(+)/NADH kinase [Deltaproteobacteria bacterium]|nr:NAD(+)/NADH kinase [Deltaproteobacteria bacterium]